MSFVRPKTIPRAFSQTPSDWPVSLTMKLRFQFRKRPLPDMVSKRSGGSRSPS